MNWLDWLIIMLVALSAFQGLRRGLLASVAGLAGTLVGLFVAYTYHRPLAAYLATNWNMEEKIMPLIKGLFKLWIPSQGVTGAGLQDKLISVGGLATGQLPNVGDYLARGFVSVVLEGLCFIALLLATSWAINLTGCVLTKVAQISLLGAPNHLGGLLFGTARGLVVVSIMLALLAPFQRVTALPYSKPVTPGAIQSRNAFEGSKLLPYFEPLFSAIGRPLNTNPNSVPSESGGLLNL